MTFTDEHGQPQTSFITSVVPVGSYSATELGYAIQGTYGDYIRVAGDIELANEDESLATPSAETGNVALPPFTRGPWMHSEGNTYFRRPGKMMTADLIYERDYGGRWIAAVWQDDFGVDEQEANAHLIAAAPDLYRAARNALDKVFNDGKREGWAEIQISALDELRAALAKAEGKG